MKKSLSITTATLAFLLFVPSLAHAASPAPTSGQALEIGPPVVTLSGDPGTTVKASIDLRDVAPNNLIVSNQINDFTAAGEDGTPKLLLQPGESTPYSLKTWITPLPQFTLVPKQIQTLTVTIKIPATASPGGYYGVIRFTGSPPGLNGTGVSLSASIGSLVFLRVNGQANEAMSLADFFTSSDGSRKNSFFESAPIVLTERVRNDGNLYEQPTGAVAITDIFGHKVVELPVNQPPRDVLPGTIRRFQETLNSGTIGNRFLFGKYTAKLELAYGSNVQILSKNIDFWVIPYRLIAAIVAGIIAVAMLARYGLIRYRERVLRGSRGGRRR